MKVKLMYFGMVAEMANTNEEIIEVENHSTSKELCLRLEKKLNNLKQLDYRLAINESLINENIELKENDIIAVLPPFAGG